MPACRQRLSVAALYLSCKFCICIAIPFFFFFPPSFFSFGGIFDILYFCLTDFRETSADANHIVAIRCYGISMFLFREK